ncbi:MAG: lactonase family protein [Bacteroidia bacterium]|jgi:6-phosphogluconolactonase|nr:lactonase family protein [Bacteroidia bacterium]
MKRYFIFIFSIVLVLELVTSACKRDLKLFVGSFTEGNEKGLSLFDFNERKGSLKLVSKTDAGPNPSFFCFSERHNLIYAINEVMELRGKPGGGITTLKYDSETGLIEKQNEILVPYGGPCYVSLSADSGFLFVANYASGSIAVVKLDKSGIPEYVSDSIKYETEKNVYSRAHMIKQDPSGKHVYVTDLGLDRIMIYDLDRNSGKLNLINDGIIPLPKESGPRHFVFNTDGSKMYVINELGSTIMVFNVDNDGRLEPFQAIPTIKKGFNGSNSCAEILIGKNGKFLYGSNRGENSIVVFKIARDGSIGLDRRISCGGDWPRNFVIDPSGRFLLAGNQKSGDISVFKINRITGITGNYMSKTKIKAPAFLEFVD